MNDKSIKTLKIGILENGRIKNIKYTNTNYQCKKINSIILKTFLNIL